MQDPKVCRWTRLENDVTNCTRLRRVRGYDRWPVKSEEKQFPLAFGIKMQEDAAMLDRLLRAVWRPHNVYVIHVDTKAHSHTARCYSKKSS